MHLDENREKNDPNGCLSGNKDAVEGCMKDKITYDVNNSEKQHVLHDITYSLAKNRRRRKNKIHEVEVWNVIDAHIHSDDSDDN